MSDATAAFTLPRSTHATAGSIAGLLSVSLIVLGGWLASSGITPESAAMLGVGLFLSIFAALFLFPGEQFIALDVEGESLVLTSSTRSEVRIPCSAIKSVNRMPAMNQGNKQLLTLMKHDGGVLQIAAYDDDEEAKGIALALNAQLSKQATPPPDGTPSGVARLDNSPSFTIKRAPNTVEIEFSSAMSLTSILYAAPFAGMILIGYAAGVGLVMAFATVLTSVIALAFLKDTGVTQRIVIDQRHLNVERLRFGKSKSTQQVPLFSIVTVDFTLQHGARGASWLHLRTGAEEAKKQSSMDQAEEIVAQADDDGELDIREGIALTQVMLGQLNSGVRLPLGKMSITDKISLDLALGEEIASRTGKRHGQL